MRRDQRSMGRACSGGRGSERVWWAKGPVRLSEVVSQEKLVWNSSPLDLFQNQISAQAIGRGISLDGPVAQRYANYQGSARSPSKSPRDRGHSTTDHFSFLKKSRCASWSLRAGAGERARKSHLPCYWKKPSGTPHITRPRCFPLTDGSPFGVPRAARPRHARTSWRHARTSWRHVPAVTFQPTRQATTRTRP